MKEMVPQTRRLVALLVLVLGVVGVALGVHGPQPANADSVAVEEKGPDQKPKVPADTPADALPEGAVTRMGSGQLRPGDGVRSVTLTADGKKVAAGIYGPTVLVWELATGKELHRLDGHRWNTYVAFSPDGKTLAAASQDSLIRVWDLATEKASLEL